MVASGWVMVVGDDCGFVGLRRKMCDFVDDLDSEKRERWVCVLVLGVEVWIVVVAVAMAVAVGSGGYGQWWLVVMGLWLVEETRLRIKKYTKILG